MTQEEFDEWQRVTKYLAQAKKRELELRLALITEIEQTSVLNIGTTQVEVFDEVLKVSITERVTVIESELDDLTDELGEEELACIKHKPSLDKKLYDKLPLDSILVLNCVTRKQGLPSIKIV